MTDETKPIEDGGHLIYNCALSARCKQILLTHDIKTVEKLSQTTPYQLLKLRSFGKCCLKEVKGLLQAKGYEWPSDNEPTIKKNQVNHSCLPEDITLRQYAAIHLRQPNSGTDWLDEMILQAKRDELAGQAMQALVSAHDSEGVWTGGGGTEQDAITTECAYNLADAMLQARKEQQDGE